jgi:hypothetical protein
MSATESPAVAIRGESVEAMRAALAGITAERDALREELETAAWERDNAQNESAFLREDVLHVEWRPFLDDATPPERTIGLLLTAGDTPPPPPADIALVSLSSGAIFVRANTYHLDSWCEYGQETTYSDWATLTERGPWVTVGTFSLRDHKAKAEARRRLFTAVHNAKPYSPNLVEWPESATWALDAVKKLGSDWRSTDKPDAWIDRLSVLVSACRSAWADEHTKLAALTTNVEATS